MSVLEAPRDAVATEVLCDHCGLPVPAGEPEASPAFCCHGCRTAYQVLHESGLDQYYRLGERRAAAVESSGRAFEEFDHPAFAELYVRRRPDGIAETELYLEGVHCASCVWLVERVPLAIPGMVSAELDMARGRVRVAWDESATPLSRIARFLDTLGYRPHPFRGVKAEAMRRREDRASLVRIGVSGAIAANTMLAAIALYSGWLDGMDGDFRRYFRWLSMLLTIPALLWPGSVFFRGAWSSLRTRTLHMDVPIAIALAAAFVRGTLNTLTDRGPVYFDGVSMLVFLLLVGRFLQQRAQRAAADSGELLHSLSPPVARLCDGDSRREVPVEALLPGMRVEVRHQEVLPADGVVTQGAAELDLSLLTGESRPQPVRIGDTVFAGTINRGGTLEICVTVTGESSRLGHLLSEVEAGAQRRAPVVRVADALAGRFVAVVLVLAVATYVYWLRRAPADALDHAIALLIVTCPCALALATPLAISVAVGRAARAGILVKGGDALESLARPATLVLDKTGTLTEGRTQLVAWDGPEWVKPLVLALERHATHPVAQGFEQAWAGVVAPSASARVTVGGGVEGEVEGRRVAVGSPSFVRARVRDAAAIPAGERSTLTPVWASVDGVLVARAGFGDALRPDAAATLQRLRERGWHLVLLSGDAPEVVEEVGRALGFAQADRHGGQSPEDKTAMIERLEQTGAVVMVGDGVNDAAAIARATVGVGVKGGAEACLAAADVFIARPGLAPLADLAEGSRRTLAVIRRNIGFSLAYNVLGAALAMAGVLTPLHAAILMPVSSLTVVLASWRSRTFEESGR